MALNNKKVAKVKKDAAKLARRYRDEMERKGLDQYATIQSARFEVNARLVRSDLSEEDRWEISHMIEGIITRRGEWGDL